MELVADVGAILGEGPMWDARDGALLWVDIVGARIFRWREDAPVEIVTPAHAVCSIAPRATGGYVGGSVDGLVALDDALRLTPLLHPETDRPGNRCNDGKLDRAGRFWAGTMDAAETAASGALYRLDDAHRCTRVDDGYRVTNGPAFSLDGRTMYHSDSALQTIYAFDLDEAGGATGKRVFARFGEGQGYPDGMTVDAEGCLWVAFWDGWCLRRLSPGGSVLEELRVPVQRPTSCCFGGEGLDRLFITSARRDLDAAALAAQPHAGGLFAASVGVAGVADTPFAG